MTHAASTSAAGTSAAGGRAMRADAARNRAAIIDAAGAVLAQQGGAADVREIARRSGVGMGTLYRHFPTKDDLLGTVLREEFLAWSDCARTTAARTEDPWTALSDFFEQALARQAAHRALMQCYAQNWCVPASDYMAEVRPLIEELLARARAAGRVRPGVTGEDLALLLAGLGQAVQLTEPQHPGLWRRTLRICLDGLRSDHQNPLPAR